MTAVFEEDGCCDTVRNFACYMIGYQKTVGIIYELQNINNVVIHSQIDMLSMIDRTSASLSETSCSPFFIRIIT